MSHRVQGLSNIAHTVSCRLPFADDILLVSVCTSLSTTAVAFIGHISFLVWCLILYISNNHAYCTVVVGSRMKCFRQILLYSIYAL